EADVRLEPHASAPLPKYLDQARRRIERGQYFHAPYMGTREFAAFFEPANDDEPTSTDIEIGTLLFDIAFVPSSTRLDLDFRDRTDKSVTGGYAQALFAQDVRVESGWWTVPNHLYSELYRLER